MIAKKIQYGKKNVCFEAFVVYSNDNDLDPLYEGDDIDMSNPNQSLVAYICPWCCKKYGLYEEMMITQEDVDKDIEYYKDEDKEDLDFCCGVDGCFNGGGIDAWIDITECEVKNDWN